MRFAYNALTIGLSSLQSSEVDSCGASLELSVDTFPGSLRHLAASTLGVQWLDQAESWITAFAAEAATSSVAGIEAVGSVKVTGIHVGIER